MGTEGITVTPKQRESVEQQLRRTDLTRRVRERLEMVKAAALGDDGERIARWSGRSVETVEHWLARFADGGVAALADAPRSGRTVQADATYLAAMERALETPPAQLGLVFDVWTWERLAAYLEQQTGVLISPGWLRALLAARPLGCAPSWLRALLAARPLGAARLGVWAAQAHAQAPARPRCCGRRPRGAGGGGGKRWGKKVRAEPGRYELHFQDETHLETNPHLCRTWRRKGKQPTLPGVGTNRRVTVFGSVEALGRVRVELVRVAAQDSAGFVRYLALLEAHQPAVQREVFLVLDNGSAHTSRVSSQALAARRDWLHVIWLAKYAPQLNPKQREWRSLKRDARSHLAASLRDFVDGILAGLRHLGGAVTTIVDEAPQWFLDGHRQPPTGRRPGRPVGSKDSYKRAPCRRKQNLPAPT